MHLYSAHRVATVLLSLTTIAAACGTSARVAPSPASRASEVATLTSDSASETVVARTNAERRRLKLPDLARSTQLMRAAQLQADQMAASLTMAHELPRARYPTLEDRLRVVGYGMRVSGENVAEGYPSAASVVAGWMTSPGHRANIVAGKYTEIGAGVATGKNGRRFWAQVFGTAR